jgi:hypothetical protein
MSHPSTLATVVERIVDGAAMHFSHLVTKNINRWRGRRFSQRLVDNIENRWRRQALFTLSFENDQ